jgi:anti-sigma regulatory factor (Ser/Thr protein kinase)
VLLIANKTDGENFSEHNRNLLEILAGQISTTISQTKLFEQYIVKKNMEKELDVAKSIQVKLLPKTLPKIKNIDVSAYNKPAKHVSGDYYDFLNHDGNYEKIGLVIADVAGKGIPAALIMSMTRAILRTQVDSNSTPSFILNRTNKFLNEDIESNRYVTMFYSIFDINNYELSFAKAGHNPPIWYRAENNTIEFLELEGFPLGMFEFAQYSEAKIKLSPGDKIIYYTDGITESMNEMQEEYTLERLCEFTKKHHSFDSRSFIERLIKEITAFSGGAEQHDDLTVLVLSASEFHYEECQIDSTREAVSKITGKFIEQIESKNLPIASFEFTMILEELLTNGVEHGNRFDPNKKVNIKYSITDYKIEFIITDEGDGFDYETILKEKEKFALYHNRGRGIQIVKELVDKFEYSNGGRTCRIVKFMY